MEYRQEMKYWVTNRQLVLLRARLAPLLAPDAHQPDASGYPIRSLYFDDPSGRFVRENEFGYDERVKYRLRTYGPDSDTARLELKYKRHGMTKKESCPLTRAQAEGLLAGKTPPFSRDMPKPLKQLYLEMTGRLLRPTLIVAYRRTAFVGRVGNVRVTFDRNIAYSDKVSDFFAQSLPLTPLLPPGQHILEVKYDELIPDYIVQAADLGELTQCTFSKYVMCRSEI